MPSGKPKKKVIDPSKYAYTSKFNGAVIKIANMVYTRRRVSKTYLRDLIHLKKETFENAILFLEQLKLVNVRMVFIDTFKMNEGTGKRKKYLFWKGYQSPGLVADLEHLIEYYNIDLSDYPIRDKTKMSVEQEMLLKKYLWKMNHSEGKISKYKLNKIYEFIDCEMYSKFVGIVDMLKISWQEMYKAVKKFIAQGKIELSVVKNSVVLYKDPEYLAKRKRWRCGNCSGYNAGRNVFCGSCGSQKE